MLNRTRVLASAAVISLIVGGLSGPAMAESLRDAVNLAYRTNPTLQAQRANQRALDETTVQARAGLRPNMSVTAGGSYTRSDSESVTTNTPATILPIDLDGDGIADATGTLPATSTTIGGSRETESLSANVQLSQTLWSGGRTSSAIAAADANILAGRENLRGVEQRVMLSVIQAYADVLRDMEILQIRQDNLSVLRRQLEESNARFEVGEITRTDVAQSEARLAQSQSDLAQAQAQLAISRSSYAAVVGQMPTNLEAMPTLPNVPSDFDAALDEGLVNNPALLAAKYSLAAAEANVASAKAEYRPRASLTASYGGSSNDFGNADLSANTSFTAGAQVTVPLFTGGLNRSRVAQSLESANAAQINIEGERRTVLQTVSSAFAQANSSRSSLIAGEEAVRAASIAAEGVRLEAQVGLRTTLDVLNQELELRNAQVALASARRNAYVAQAQLLSSIGRLSGASLDPTMEVYSAEDNYRAVRNRGALPWDGVVEAIDSIGSPRITPTAKSEDAPIDRQLSGEVVRTAPIQ